jgi:hypothetical protein
MRRVLHGVTVVALLAGAPAAAREREGQRVPTARELRQCPHLARADWRRVSRDLARRQRDNPGGPAYDPNEEHRRIRGPWPLPDLGRAEIVIDIAIGSGETQEFPTSTSSFVWREPGGAWQVDRIDYVFASPPPPPPGSPPMSAEDLARSMRPATRGPLSREQAEAIDRVLADPCFAIQPDVTPFELPLRTGQGDRCYGAISRTVRIRRGAETRLVSDICGRWPSHALANAVMYAALGLDSHIAQTLRARFPDAEIGIASLREGRRWGTSPAYCGELTVDGRAVPMVFRRWYDHGRYRNDLFVPGETDFDYYWPSLCAPEQAPAPGSGGS